MGLLHQRTVPQPRLHPPSPAVHTTPSAPMQCRRTPWLRWHTPPLPRPLRAADDDPTTADIHSMDTNQLQTALNVAIASEDYALAAQLRNVLSALLGEQPTPSDWRQSGILDWIAERAERLGFRYPTAIQKRTVPVIMDGADCIVRSATGSGKTMSFLLPALSSLPYPPTLDLEDVQAPLCLVLVPTRELGVQIVMLVYKLFGGSVNAGVPGEASNMFAFTGPRGLKVRGVVLAEEVERSVHGDYLRGAHVVVGVPSLLARVLEQQRGGRDLLSSARVVVVDEVDECFAADAEATKALLDAAVSRASSRPHMVFVGATVGPGLAEAAVAAGWLDDPVTIDMGGNSLPAGLQHRFVVVPEDRKLAVMARQMRTDLREQEADAPPARVMVFARSQDEAQALAGPLRNVLWGEHRISVLLPEGEDPIRALHSFRDNQSTLLLATPSAARGLDLPAVSHVYNVDAPEDAKGYLHRAGRAGRIGSTVPGVVTTLVTAQQLPALQRVVCTKACCLLEGANTIRGIAQADELQIELQQLVEPAVEPLAGPLDEDERTMAPSEMDRLKQGLEDLYNLF